MPDQRANGRPPCHRLDCAGVGRRRCMVDRCKFVIADLSEDIATGWEPASDIDLREWDVSEPERFSRDPKTNATLQRKSRIALHKRSGMRISGPLEFGPTVVEVSLACIMHGTNGCLIRNQSQLAESCRAVEILLREVAPNASFRIQRIRSIELTWHFDGNTSSWIPFYSCLRHPRIKRLPATWRDEYTVNDFALPHETGGNVVRPDVLPVRTSLTSVVWMGENLKVKLYDKTAEAKLSSVLPPIMRLEFTAKGHLAANLTKPDGWLDFDKVYGRYRALAGMFRQTRIPHSIYDSPVDYLLSLKMRGLIPEAEFAIFFSRQSRSTQYRYMVKAQSHEETWQLDPGIIARLPFNGPPNAPDVIRP